MHNKEDARALTGLIISTDGGSSQSQQQLKTGWLSSRTTLEIALTVALAAAVACVVGLGVGLSHSKVQNNSCISPTCIHALGGGSVKPGGSLDSAAPAYCKAQLRAYADPEHGAYWQEVQTAMNAAMATFGFENALAGTTTTPTSTTHTNTLLHNNPHQDSTAPLLQQGSQQALSRSLLGSTSQEEQQQQQGAVVGAGGLLLGGPGASAGPSVSMSQPEPSKDKVVVFDIDETVLSNMPQLMDPVTWPWDKWVDAAQAPALKPTLRFYNALCSAGYSVAFVTGRKEASRNKTASNLEAAGYGKPCQKGPGPFYGSMTGGSNGSSDSSSDGCCYAALFLRQPQDTRLASVYKPWARKQLLSAGNLTLVALVGDQFSDLNGEESAPYAFKLPNPFYYIL